MTLRKPNLLRNVKSIFKYVAIGVIVLLPNLAYSAECNVLLYMGEWEDFAVEHSAYQTWTFDSNTGEFYRIGTPYWCKHQFRGLAYAYAYDGNNWQFTGWGGALASCNVGPGIQVDSFLEIYSMECEKLIKENNFGPPKTCPVP